MLRMQLTEASDDGKRRCLGGNEGSGSAPLIDASERHGRMLDELLDSFDDRGRSTHVSPSRGGRTQEREPEPLSSRPRLCVDGADMIIAQARSPHPLAQNGSYSYAHIKYSTLFRSLRENLSISYSCRASEMRSNSTLAGAPSSRGVWVLYGSTRDSGGA